MRFEEGGCRRDVVHHDSPAIGIDVTRSHELLERARESEVDAFMEDVVLLDLTLVVADEMQNEGLDDLEGYTGGDEYPIDRGDPKSVR